MQMTQENTVLDAALEAVGTLVEKGISLSPLVKNHEEAIAIYGEACHLYETGDMERAVPLFQMLVLAYPGNWRFHFSLASSLMEQKQYKHALLVWSSVQMLIPHDCLAFFHAAECCFSLDLKQDGLLLLSLCEEKANMQEDIDPMIIARIEVLKKLWSKT